MGTGTLYTSLKKLLAKGLIEEIEERPAPELDDSRRRYYRLTPEGRRAADAEAARLERILGVARVKALSS